MVTVLPSFTNLQVQFRGSVVQVFRGNLLPPHIEGHLFGQGFGKEFVFGLAGCLVLDLGDRHYGPTGLLAPLIVTSRVQ